MYTEEHQAMATQFRFQIQTEHEETSKAIMQEAFAIVDDLELTLSRFIPDSDISRINRLKKNEHLPIELETWEIIKNAIAISKKTYGAFNINVGEYMNIFKGAKEGILNANEVNDALKKAYKISTEASIYVDPDQPKVYCINEGIKIDLGAIGKGYALDSVKDFLEENGINIYTLEAGDSTILSGNNASPNTSWSYQLTSPTDCKNVQLKNTSISASGTYWQGAHIFNPKTGRNELKDQFDRVWVCTDNAALSDALSTAFFVMPEEELKEVVNQIDSLNWVAYIKNGKIETLTNSN
ncbi:FAD:protein FMN transferase [Spongiivirga citrea]|uniref:FAD:protein FMN transferase n=1 Tax=Spongiivirga citrea TaxID=1481457 RepID=A0A6M0CM51_9FLAO|nr:FAD:protein FMN transferase [Spongiivirga citrea]NER19015.1 hypothetical protein [Spongiivirga citrea]